MALCASQKSSFITTKVYLRSQLLGFVIKARLYTMLMGDAQCGIAAYSFAIMPN